MSDSRLEKFIYTICSMDVSDLPVPLSRIEKLWNCLITGETPDFEPLSRNEKYLMAMLDRYDISNLPAPMSRGEKLLYKIAVGETDLSDVPGYLSRYEELLKYLIENGGISGGDFEYVLYTLNQSLNTLYLTAEKPVKSAILKGHTLVNIATKHEGGSNVGGEVLMTPTLLKGNTKYYIKVIDDEFNLNRASFRTNDWVDRWYYATNGVVILTTPSKDDFDKYMYLTFRITKNGETVGINNTIRDRLKWIICEYQEYMENWDIPYFEGMQSVKMSSLTTTGKNLFDKTKTIFDKTIDLDTGIIIDDSSANVTDFIKVIPNTQYTISFNFTTSMWTRCFGLTEPKHGKYITNANGTNDKCYFDSDSKTITFTTSPTTNYLIFLFGKGVEESFQLEQGSTATTYEPYKSNILSTPEEVVLRSLPNGVCDTLNVETGEYVQRIGEITFNGSETWQESGNVAPNHYCAFTEVKGSKNVISYNIMCNSLPVKNILSQKIDSEGCVFNRCTSGNMANVIVKIANSKLSSASIEGVKVYLQSNPLTVQYELATPIIKTVDLTVVNQDNQPTQLGTFENVTHVSLEAENLIPEVEMEVATRISEELASASPLMDDISTKQEQLNTMVDEQSENVDATMIATTEIYEETL